MAHFKKNKVNKENPSLTYFIRGSIIVWMDGLQFD